MNKKLCAVLLVLCSTLLQVSCKSSKKKNKKPKIKSETLLDQADASVQSVLTKTSRKIKALEISAAEQRKEMEKEVQAKAETIRKSAEKTALKIQEEADRKSQELAKELRKESEKLNQKIKEQAESLKKEALAKVVEQINKEEEKRLLEKRRAEEKELREKQKQREKLLAQKLSTPLEPNGFLSTANIITQEAQEEVPASWKENKKIQFEEHLSSMKQIILDGETEEEASDFIKRFNSQSAWLDTALTGTQFVGDENYQEIIKRTVKLENIIRAQKKADSFLNELTEDRPLTSRKLKKARLLLLYELNTQVSKKGAPGEKIIMSDGAIKFLVEQIIDEVKKDLITTEREPKKVEREVMASPPTPERKQQLTISTGPQISLEKLASEVSELKKALDKETAKRKKSKKKSKVKIMERDEKITELEELLAQAQSSVQAFKNRMSTSEQKLALEIQDKDKISQKMKQERSEKEKTIAELEEMLLDAQKSIATMSGKTAQEVAAAKDKIIKTKDEELKKEKERIAAEQKKNAELESKTRKALEDIVKLKDEALKADQQKATEIKKTKKEIKGKLKTKLETANRKTIELESNVTQQKNKISHLQDKVKKAQQEIKQTEDRLQKDLEQKERDKIDLEIAQKKAERNIAELLDKVRQAKQEQLQAAQQAARDTKKEIKPLLETKSKENVELESKIIQLNHKAQADKRRAEKEKKQAVREAEQLVQDEMEAIIMQKEDEQIAMQETMSKALENTINLQEQLNQAEERKQAAVTQIKRELNQTLREVKKENLELETQGMMKSSQIAHLQDTVKKLSNESKNKIKQSEIREEIAQRALAQSHAKIRHEREMLQEQKTKLASLESSLIQEEKRLQNLKSTTKIKAEQSLKDLMNQEVAFRKKIVASNRQKNQAVGHSQPLINKSHRQALKHELGL